MCRPDLTLLPIPIAIAYLSQWIAPKVPPKIIHAHEKVSAADLLAIAILRVDLRLEWPSLTQAHIRLKRLLPVLEALLHEVECPDFVLIDSEPIPACPYKRAKHCKFPGAAFGFTTQGMIYGFKLHVCTALNGRIVRYKIRPASEHDLTAQAASSGLA